MSRFGPRRLGVVLGLGLAYLAVGLVSGSLTAGAATSATRTRWRLAAWAISGIAFVAQIAWERRGLRKGVAAASFDAAAAAAFGGLFLAIAATIHKATVGNVDARYLLALVAWPLLVAVPAFLAALIVGTVVRPRPVANPFHSPRAET